MKHYLMLAIAYLAVAVLIVLLSREDSGVALQSAWIMTKTMVPAFGLAVAIFFLIGVVYSMLTRARSMRSVVISVLMASIATLVFHSAFPLIKTSLPYVTPFYADISLAKWDFLLHGGQDPWVWTHAIAAHLPMDWVVPVYLHVWVWPALCLPVIIAATDTNTERAGRTLILYAVAWVLIGNVMATAGMSAGPVYYDRLYGGERFGELTAAIAATPAIVDYFGSYQDDLWTVYIEQEQALGSGISAFPSVHVAIAMVSALYMWERSKVLGVIGAAFVLTILFLSVYSGYHYALDGYFSIAVIGLAWELMRRRARTTVTDLTASAGLPA